MTGEVTTETVELQGKDFHIAEEIGAMPLMQFAKLAADGEDGMDEMSALAAIYDFLEQTVHPTEWKAFTRHATTTRANEEQLLEFVSKVYAIFDGRPTVRSSDSSDGPQTIEPSSTAGSFSPGTARVIEKFNEEGRPDLALVVRRRAESLTA